MAGSVFVATSFPGIWFSVVDSKRVGCVLSADFDSVGTGVLCSGCQRLFFCGEEGRKKCVFAHPRQKKNKIKKFSQVKFKNATVDNFPVGVRR